MELGYCKEALELREKSMRKSADLGKGTWVCLAESKTATYAGIPGRSKDLWEKSLRGTLAGPPEAEVKTEVKGKTKDEDLIGEAKDEPGFPKTVKGERAESSLTGAGEGKFLRGSAIGKWRIR